MVVPWAPSIFPKPQSSNQQQSAVHSEPLFFLLVPISFSCPESSKWIDASMSQDELPLNISANRTRRSTVKAVDYSKEQEFSDDDIFEDDLKQEKRRSTSAKSRKSMGDEDERDIPERPSIASTSRAITTAPAPTVSQYMYYEKGYDTSLGHLRDRFTFMPEFEPDGSPKVDLIVGRRPIQEENISLDDRGIQKTKKVGGDSDEGNDDEEQDDDEEDDDISEGGGKRSRKRRPSKQTRSAKRTKVQSHVDSNVVNEPPVPGHHSHVEYEYLVKYKGRSYLHLEWKKASDLESMNKSAKAIYRRFLKKLELGTDENLEDPEIDPSYIQPQRILDEDEHEIMVDLSDKELVQWEKERLKQMEEDDTSEEEEPEEKMSSTVPDATSTSMDTNKETAMESEREPIPDPGILTYEDMVKILKKDEPYYPVVQGSDNPYRDGYITEPPKKPRGSYLFFQCIYRAEYQRRFKGDSVADIMQRLGDAWRGLSEQQQAPFLQLAKEELAQYEFHRSLVEKAQKPSELWQPLRRCRMVLDRLSNDGYANIFLEPVDLNEFSDYLEFVDQPIDLGMIRKKLETKKYMGPEQFARDMRKVWSNCKIYNQHGSAIWYVADYMSKQFERLYNAWVLEFRERYLRWADPKARPWEQTCRQCDGKCGTPDDKMVLCDHCDAMYGLHCLRPRLLKAPKGIWHCPDCAPKMTGIKAPRMLSALAENAARRRVELGGTPKKKITERLFLVKWAGLSYEFCTWERQEDINDDTLIAEFRGMSTKSPDEPTLTEDDVEKTLASARHLTVDNAGGSNDIPRLRFQLYSQVRAFQFLKFGRVIPKNLAVECGLKTKAFYDSGNDGQVTDAVLGKMNDKGQSAHVHGHCDDPSSIFKMIPELPPLFTGEYDAIVPVTSKGLLMNVGEVHKAVAFLGYRQLPDGSKGPAEKANLIKSVGDKIIAVDGVSAVNKSFKEVIGMLKEAGHKQYTHMRFLSSKYSLSDCELTSMGSYGKFTMNKVKKHLKRERRLLLIKRNMEFEGVEEPVDNDYESDDESVGTDDDSSSDDESEFDDDDIGFLRTKSLMKSEAMELDSVNTPNVNKVVPDASATDEKVDKTSNEESNVVKINPEGDNVRKQETTQSLAVRLLGMDVGYSSDEAGDESCAYFIDGVDCTFSTSKECGKITHRDEGKETPDDGKDAKKRLLPVKRSEFSSLGDRAKLVSTVSLSKKEIDVADFENYPLPSSASLISVNNVIERQPDDVAGIVQPLDSSPAKISKTKIEQVSIANNEVIRVWASVEDAAATLQISLKDLKEVLKGEYNEETGDEVSGYKWRYAPEKAEVTKLISDKEKDKGKKAFYEFRDKLYDHEKPHLYKNGNRLRDYQIDGVNWLASCWYKRHGCILADEMGLGKTCQIVTYIEHLSRVENIRRPHLVVVPLSTVEHWRREIEAWTDLVCCVYHEQKRLWRDVMREYEWYYVDRPHTADFLKFDVLVTTYDTMIADFDVIGQIPWRVSVVDEAHRLRNQRGKLLECMREISGKGTLQYGFQSRILMTGTPLQNNIQELWTLLNFIEPFKFPSVEEFEASYGNMSSQEQVEALQKKISPFMLRRVKEDVAKDIPSKEETIIDVELTSVQKTYYRAIFERNLAFLNMGSRQSAPKLMNIQMELRKCCNHPFLLDGAEAREMGKYEKELLESGDFYGKSAEHIHNHLQVMGYIQTSGKMVLLDKLLPKLREEGHKILIFSQMVRMLDLLSEYFDFRKFNYERLDGKVRGNDRQKAIDRFNTQPDSFIFMLSTRAGGVGINLTAADIVIIFDSDWNPQNDIQAQARCHRIGQTKNVMIYRLITSRSFEQEMFDRASKKLGLEQAVLGTFGQDDDDGKPTAQEMEQLLKKGAYALLEDENDEMTREFCADDIENILAKRTRTRVVEGTKTASWLNKQGLVTKSKFRADSKSAALDVDDPLFWQKVMPDFVTPAIMLKKLDDLECTTLPSSNGAKVGRGRGRRKKQSEIDSDKDEAMESEDASIVSDDESEKKSKKHDLNISKSNQRLVNKFFHELKSLMESIFDDIEDGNFPDSEKAICQTLLLSVSVKAKLFSEDQRLIALSYLERLEGGRRRKCRDETNVIEPKSKKAIVDRESSIISDQFLIKSTKRKKRIVRDNDEDDDKMDKEGIRSDLLDDDGYLHHSDSDEVWSEVAEDPYNSAQKNNGISMKEARRRRAWASDKDPAVAAGKPWPSLPRNKVSDVLTTLIDLIIQEDMSKGGLFSVPVPMDSFPEYYEVIQTPMDYGTIKQKIMSGKYRSAQAMQKDLVLVTSNCLQFNSTDSDIVKEIKSQSLNRPNLLKKAAFEHGLFLAEDGSVLDILPESKSDNADKEQKTSRKDKKNEKPSGGGKIKINLKLFPTSESTPDEVEKVGKKRSKKSVIVSATPPEGAAVADEEKSAKKKKSLKKQKEKASVDRDVYLDQHLFETERSQLDGSVDQIREYFTKRGEWKLPHAVEEKFEEVAKLTLSKVCKLDQYSLFTVKVNDDDAPQYYEIVENPMDFGTMRMKVDNLEYGSGSNAAALLYNDFLRVLDNCLLYNHSNQEILDEAARIFSVIPEMYVSACNMALKRKSSSK